MLCTKEEGDGCFGDESEQKVRQSAKSLLSSERPK